MKNRQTFILVIGRINLQQNLIPPLGAIIPALQLISPIKIYTSLNQEIKGENLYEALVYHLQNQYGECSMNQTLSKILKENQKTNFRVCIMGSQNVDWDVIMNYKRKKILIDTAGSNPKLAQISFVTGGINKKIRDSTMIKTFLCCFGLSSNLRQQFRTQSQPIIQFSLECKCCNPPKQLKNDLFVCSVCLAVYCPVKETKPQKCKICDAVFDNDII